MEPQYHRSSENLFRVFLLEIFCKIANFSSTRLGNVASGAKMGANSGLLARYWSLAPKSIPKVPTKPGLDQGPR